MVADLKPLLPSLSITALPELAERVEDVARFRLLESLADFAPQLCSCKRAVTAGCLVDPSGTLVNFCAADDLQDKRRLGIAFVPVGEGSPRMRQRQVTVVGPGRYTKVRYYWPEDMKFDIDLLTDMTRAVLETAYSWFKTAVEIAIDRERLSLGQHLYRTLRTIIPNEKLRENLWFAAVTEDYGFRLLDTDLADAAFHLVKPNAPNYTYSTNRLVSEILSTRLPRAQLLMQQAVTENRCIEADLSSAVYKKEGSIYASALAALYGSERFTVSPISTKGSICVVALYPSLQRSAIDPLLVAHRAELEAEVKRSLSIIHRTLRSFERRASLSYSHAGEFVGGVLKAFTGH